MTDNTDALPPLPQPLVWTRYSDHGPDGAFTADQMRDYARAALAQRQQVPEGWKLVPVEPTEDMLFGAEMSAPRGYRDLYAAMLSASPQAPAQREPSDRWYGAEEWMPLAWELCADECGEEACNELVWEGGPVPEPWGERWLKYEYEAKRLIALVRQHVPAASPQRAVEPLTDEQIDALDTFSLGWMAPRSHESVRAFARAIERAHGIGKQEGT